jgi:hypothetical protein
LANPFLRVLRRMCCEVARIFARGGSVMGIALRVFGFGLAGVGAYLYSVSSAESRIYPLPLTETYEMLAQMPVLPRGVDSVTGLSIAKVDIFTNSVRDQSVTWYFSLKGQKFASYTGELKPYSDTSTQIIFHFDKFDPKKSDDDLIKFMDFDALRRVTHNVMIEHFYSTLDKRPVNMKKIAEARGGFMMSGGMKGVATAQMNEMMSKMNEASESMTEAASMGSHRD